MRAGVLISPFLIQTKEKQLSARWGSGRYSIAGWVLMQNDTSGNFPLADAT